MIQKRSARMRTRRKGTFFFMAKAENIALKGDK